MTWQIISFLKKEKVVYITGLILLIFIITSFFLLQYLLWLILVSCLVVIWLFWLVFVIRRERAESYTTIAVNIIAICGALWALATGLPGIALLNQINSSGNLAGSIDIKPVPPLSYGARTLHPQSNTFWIYVGQTPRDKTTPLISPIINTSTVPHVGMSFLTAADVYEHASQPQTSTNGGWVMGNLVGILSKNSTVLVTSTDSVPGLDKLSYWWLEVEQQ